MEARNFYMFLDCVGTCGVILSAEQKATLQSSLTILQSNQKFAKVKFWGKILGTTDDYFIAQGFPDDEFGETRTLYSKDCVTWGLLAPATKETRAQAKLFRKRFTGDPAFEAEYAEERGADDPQEDAQTTMKEEIRLSAVIANIDNDTNIVPRGAFVKTPKGEVYSNRTFEGLGISDAARLGSYMHLREPVRLYEKSLLQRADLDKSIDFMDTIDEDIPKGTWSLQFDRGSGLVIVKNLLWLGYNFYLIPGTRFFGSVYVGCGDMNIDLPFML